MKLNEMQKITLRRGIDRLTEQAYSPQAGEALRARLLSEAAELREKLAAG